jgi:hypothetical protein
MQYYIGYASCWNLVCLLFIYNVEKLAMVNESNCRVLVFLLFYNVLGAIAGVSFLSSVKIAKIYS